MCKSLHSVGKRTTYLIETIFRYRRTRKNTSPFWWFMWSLSKAYSICLQTSGHLHLIFLPGVALLLFQEIPSLLLWIRHLRESSSLISSIYLKEPTVSLSLQGHGERSHNPEHPKQSLLCSPVSSCALGPARGTAALARLCQGVPQLGPLQSTAKWQYRQSHWVLCMKSLFLGLCWQKPLPAWP